MNLIVVHVNGLVQIPGIDFVASSNQISFTAPPQSGSRITIHTPFVAGTGGVVKMFEGNGSTYLWDLSDEQEDRELQTLLKDAWDFRTIPIVADILERLAVVVNLVKQDDTLR